MDVDKMIELERFYFDKLEAHSDFLEISHSALYLYIVKRFYELYCTDMVFDPDHIWIGHYQAFWITKSWKTYTQLLIDLESVGLIELGAAVRTDNSTCVKLVFPKNIKSL